MEDQDINSIESIENTEGDDVKVVVKLSKKKLSERFIPHYQIQDDLRRALTPILLEEILKNKDEIVKKVLLDVNWPEIVRSEVAQRVIKQIASSNNNY